MEKAKKIYSMGNKYYFETHFEYRGHEYIVEYSSGYTTFNKKPAWLQHKEAQENIDRIISNPISNDIKPYSGCTIDDIYRIMEWD